MKKMIQGTALLVAVCCGVWLAVLWRWQATPRALSGTDVAVYLVVLPLVVFGFVLAFRWAGRAAWAAAPGGAGAAAPVAPGSGPGTAPRASTEAAQRHATVQLLAAALNCACADRPPALLAAGAAGQPRPALDKQLLNAEGLPVMACRIAELPLDALQACLPLLRPVPAADADPVDPPALHVQRALAALAAPLDQALQGLAPWQAWLADARSPVPVRVLLAWPDLWPEDDGALALAWLRQRLASAEGPGAGWVWRIEGRAMTGVELLAEADRRLHAGGRHRSPELLLLAACHSDLSDEAIAVLEHQRRLFSPAERPKGLIPSESAAVLVLAPADWPAAPDTPDAPVHLHRPAITRRDKAIDAPGRVSSDTLVHTLTDALAAAQRPAAEVAALVCDADQHSPRGTELFGALLATLPQLDPTEHLCMTGELAGQGEAGPLMAVAAAAARARADNAPCVALSVGDSHWRLALLARPAPTAPTAPAAATPASRSAAPAA
ncbi:MAG: hypothetical protein HY855_06400 [Burkholderiales bacterium]|nr:hypothetical protein [Burkholderiales bacterium]